MPSTASVPFVQSMLRLCFCSYGRPKITSGPSKGHLYKVTFSSTGPNWYRTMLYWVTWPVIMLLASRKVRGLSIGRLIRLFLRAKLLLTKPYGVYLLSINVYVGNVAPLRSKTLVKKEKDISGFTKRIYRSLSVKLSCFYRRL